MKENTEKQQKQDDDIIDFRSIRRYFVRHWWWYAISLAFFLTGAYLYLHKVQPTFLNKALMMINQEEDATTEGPASQMLSMLGAGGGSAAAENEQMKLLSHTAMKNVVEELDLNKVYWRSNGFFKRRTNFFQNSPFRVEIPRQILDTITVTTKFKISGPDAGPFHIKATQAGENGSDVVADVDVKEFPYNVKTPYGTFTIIKADRLPANEDFSYNAIVMSTPMAIEDLKTKFGVNYLSVKADAFEVSMEDGCPARGRAIVNSVLRQYNLNKHEDRMAYNRQIIDSIDARLISLYRELEQSGIRLADYKTSHNITHPQADVEYTMKLKGTTEEARTQIAAGVKIREMIQQKLASGKNYDLIPYSADGMGGSPGFSDMITDYNKLLMERSQLLTTAKENSAPVKKLEAQINAMRDNLLTSVSRDLEANRIMYADLTNQTGKADSRLSSIPNVEREMSLMYRDTEVKNQVYLYLLTRREELLMASSKEQPLGKVIDEAYTDVKPIAPRNQVIWASAAVVGLLIPTIMLYLMMRRVKPEDEEETKA